MWWELFDQSGPWKWLRIARTGEVIKGRFQLLRDSHGNPCMFVDPWRGASWFVTFTSIEEGGR